MVWTAADFESDSGMLTSVWGPALWHTLHTVSFNYPNNPDAKTKKRYKHFLKSLRHILPCSYCRENYSKNLREAGYCEDIFRNRKSFSHFVYRLHNHVNRMLGKPPYPSYEKVRNQYENFRSRCLQNPEDERCEHKHTHVIKEKGCTEPLYGTKSKCLIRIVPKESKHRTFAMDARCRARRAQEDTPLGPT